MTHNRQWYTLKNETGKVPELYIYDDIDDWYGVSAKGLVDQLKEIDAAEITVRINSRGGSVFEGIAIYNALRLHQAKIHVSIEGLAASIATVVAMAGDTVTMAENALLMIHNPYGWTGGDAEELRKVADMLDKVTDSIALSYTARNGKTLDEMKALMDEETWFTAAEAKEAGLVDEIDEPIKLAASIDLSRFSNAPKGWGNAEVAQEPQQKPQSQKTGNNEQAIRIAGLCKDAGYPDKTREFLVAGMSEVQVQQRLTDFETVKTLCTAARCGDRAETYIAANKSPDFVRNALFDLLTAEDANIDNSLSPDQQNSKAQPLIDTQSIYRNRNR